MILYRPVGLQELELIYDSDMKAFPARLPQQPIFYPVLELEYARQTASDWNAKSGQFAGYVTQFKVEDEYISQFQKHTVGGSQHQEFWIPAEEVEGFNGHIAGHIKVVEAYFGDGFQGFIPDKFGLQGKNAVEQFTLLTNSYLYKRMDFYLEIKRNHKAVFLNYLFWQKYDFKNPGLKTKVLQTIKEAWLTSFPKIPLPMLLAVQENTPPVKQTDVPAQAQRSVNVVHEDVTPVEQTDSQSSIKPRSGDVMPAKQTDASANAQRFVNAAQEDSAPIKPTDAPAYTQRVVNPVHQETTRGTETVSHFSQGIELGLSGKVHEAIEELSRAVEENPDEIMAHTSLGVAFQRLKNDDRALSCYEAALKLDPDDAEAHYFRANLLYSHGNVREAVAGYTIAIGLKPELIEAHEKPVPQDRLTDYSSAPAEIHKIAKPAHRILDLNKLLEANPGRASIFKERAAEYYRLWNYEQAIADYSSWLTIQPDDASALHLRGVAYEQLRQFDRAVEDYQRAAAIDPDLSNGYIDRGVTLGQTGNFRQSIASLTEGIRLAPRNPDGYFNRGTSYVQLGDFERAIEDFSMVIQLFPSDEAAYYWRGISNEAAGRREEAIADYKRFLTLSQDANARQEIEQRLSQWNAGTRDRASSQGAVPDDKQKTDQAPSEQPDQKLDLYDLIVALGDRALDSIWLGSGVDCDGEGAEELFSFTNQKQPIAGQDFLRITSGIRQTIKGDFQAFDAGAASPWILIRAWDGEGFYIETNDPKIKKQLKTHFQAVEEVEGASPPYEGLFIRI